MKKETKKLVITIVKYLATAILSFISGQNIGM